MLPRVPELSDTETRQGPDGQTGAAKTGCVGCLQVTCPSPAEPTPSGGKACRWECLGFLLRLAAAWLVSPLGCPPRGARWSCDRVGEAPEALPAQSLVLGVLQPSWLRPLPASESLYL